MNTDSCRPESGLSPGSISRKWRSIGYRIKGRVANLIAAQNGKKKLRDGTKERLEKEVLDDLEYIASEKKRLQHYPDTLKEVLQGVSRQEQLWKQRGSHHPKPYNRAAIEYLLSIPPSKSEIFFVETFLHEILRIRKSIVEEIVLHSNKK